MDGTRVMKILEIRYLNPRIRKQMRVPVANKLGIERGSIQNKKQGSSGSANMVQTNDSGNEENILYVSSNKFTYCGILTLVVLTILCPIGNGSLHYD